MCDLVLNYHMNIALLTNFKPVPVPSASNGSMNKMDKYFENIDSEESNEEYGESDFDE